MQTSFLQDTTAHMYEALLENTAAIPGIVAKQAAITLSARMERILADWIVKTEEIHSKYTHKMSSEFLKQKTNQREND